MPPAVSRAPTLSDSIAANTCFELGSVTKVFTTLLLAYAAANVQGVTLLTTVGQILPDITQPAIANTTLLELATYTNCIADHAPGQSKKTTTWDEIVAFLNSPAAVQGNCTQGSTYFYSDLAVGLLGTCLGQALSGSVTAWTELIPLLITGPLGRCSSPLRR